MLGWICYQILVKLISEKKQSVRLKAGTYEPKIQISGSSVRYKTKNVFTEIFEEQDVLDFMKIVDLSTVSAPEIAIGELKRKAEIILNRHTGSSQDSET